MSTKKLVLGLTSAVALAGLVWSTSSVATTPTLARPGKSPVANTESGTLPAHSSAACAAPVGPCCMPCNYFENFDNLAHFSTATGVPAGNIVNQGDPADQYDRWTVTCSGNASTTSVVSAANPLSATQHLRLSYDATLPTSTTLGCVVSARVPASAVATPNNPPITPTTLSLEIAISDPFVSEFNVQPQAVGQGFLTARVMFFYGGSLYVLDDTGGGCCTFVNAGTWNTSGAYTNLTLTMNPCNNTMHYDYGNGAAIYDGAVGIYAGSNIDQLLVYTDNFAGAANYDVDNVNIIRDPNPCPAVCGDGVITNPEQCDIGDGGAIPAIDTACPGRCQADCSCSIPCGGAIPGDPCQACDIVNDVPYTEITTGGWFTFTAGAPAYAFETCGVVNYDSALSVWSGDCTSLVLIESNDDCDDNTFGFGDNADPLASCYAVGGIASPYQACLCVETTIGQTYFVSDDRADNGLGRVINIVGSKRLTCDALWGDRGACCDSNGADAGCVDDVDQTACSGPDKTFTLRKSCASLTCACVPNCAGIACGDDGCGGSCGTCDDSNACTTDACNGGVCEFTPVSCPDDGLFCNGAESCSGGVCVHSGDPCTAPDTCNEATDTCDVPNPVIPTVSEWGLAIMSLLLLVGLKVYFGRREALA